MGPVNVNNLPDRLLLLSVVWAGLGVGPVNVNNLPDRLMQLSDGKVGWAGGGASELN